MAKGTTPGSVRKKSRKMYWILGGVISMIAAAALSLPLMNALGDDGTRKLEHFHRGEEYFASQQYAEAVIEWRNAAQLDPSFADAFYQLGRAYLQLNSPRDAFFALDRCVELDPTLTDAAIMLANLHLQAGNLTEGRELVDQIVTLEPHNISGHLLAARHSLLDGDQEAARESIDKAFAIRPDHLETSLLSSALEMVQGRPDEAERILHEARATHGDSVTADLALANYYQLTGEPAKAEQAYLTAVEQAPEDGRTHFLAGRHYAAMALPKDAIRYFRKTLELLPTHPAARKHLAHLVMLQGDTAAADSLIQKLLEDDQNDLDAIYLDGRAKLRRNERDAALEALDRVAVLNPNYTFGAYPADLGYYLALALVSTGNPVEARDTLRRLFDRNPDLPPAHLLAAEIDLRRGDFDDARKHATIVVDADQNHVPARLLLAQAIIRGAPSEAVAAVPHLRRVLEKRPDHLPAGLLLSQALLRAGKVDEAGTFLLAIAAEHDSSAAAKVALAAFHMARGDVAAADTAYQEAIGLEPENSRVHLLAGQFHLLRNQPDRAAELFERGRQLDPEASGPRKHLAYLHLQQRREAAADSLVQEILAISDEDIDGLYLQGRVLLRHGQHKKALASLERVALQAPEYSLGVYPRDFDHFLALALHLNGRSQEARQQLAGRPLMPQGVLLDAEAALALGDNRSAEEIVRRYLEAVPEDSDASLLLGKTLLQGGRADESLEVFHRVLEKHPDLPPAHFGAGLSLWQLERISEAITAMENALRLKPGSADAMGAITQLLINDGRAAEALDRCRAHIAASPDDAAGHQLLAVVLSMQQETDEAIAALQRALALDPNNGRGHFLLGSLHEEQRQFADAITHYERTLELDRNAAHAAQAANNLAWLYAETGGDLERAWELAEMASQRLPGNPNVLDTLGWVYLKHSNFRRAVGVLEESVRLSPDSAILRYHLGMAYYGSGDSTAARNSFEKSLDIEPAHANADTVRHLLANLSETGSS